MSSSESRRRRSSGLGADLKIGSSGLGLTTINERPLSSGTLQSKPAGGREAKGPKIRKTTRYRKWKRSLRKNTWLGPLTLIGVFLSLYIINPSTSNPIHHFLFLSYPVAPKSGSAPDTPLQYGKGLWDIAFVSFYIIVLSFTREFIMQRVLQPMARYNGFLGRKKQYRYMEQMYTAIYFGITGPWGLYIMSRTSMWFFNTRAMYEGYPHKTHEGLFKFYYLFQAAYWLQQAIVMLLGLEARRKDFWELVGHHVVTVMLITLSYRFHFTYMGLGVFISHDISDCFFAISKVLNYLDHPIVPPFFASFILCWCYLRHYLNLKIIYSEFTEFKTVGPYELDWAAGKFKCELSHYISTALLIFLQLINIFWLFLILRVVYRYVIVGSFEDVRSDNEEG